MPDHSPHDPYRADRLRRFASGLAGQAFSLRGGFADTLRSLAACVALAAVALLLLRLFSKVGVWLVIALAWVAIAGFLWRYRGNIRLDRLATALRTDVPPSAKVGSAPVHPVVDTHPGDRP